MELEMLFKFPRILILIGALLLLISIVLGIFANKKTEEEDISLKDKNIDKVIEHKTKKVRKPLFKKKEKIITEITPMIDNAINESLTEQFIDTEQVNSNDPLDDTIALDMKQVEAEIANNNILFDGAKIEDFNNTITEEEIEPVIEIKEDIPQPEINNEINFAMDYNEELIEPIIINTTPIIEEQKISIETSPIEEQKKLVDTTIIDEEPIDKEIPSFTRFEDVFNKESDPIVEPIIENSTPTMEIPIIKDEEIQPRINAFEALRNKGTLEKTEESDSDNISLNEEPVIKSSFEEKISSEEIVVTETEPLVESIVIPKFDDVVSLDNNDSSLFEKEVTFEVPSEYKVDDFDSFKNIPVINDEKEEVVFKEEPLREVKPIYGGINPADTIDLTFINEARKTLYNQEN